jgi:hypothetical protein
VPYPHRKYPVAESIDSSFALGLVGHLVVVPNRVGDFSTCVAKAKTQEEFSSLYSVFLSILFSPPLWRALPSLNFLRPRKAHQNLGANNFFVNVLRRGAPQHKFLKRSLNLYLAPRTKKGFDSHQSPKLPERYRNITLPEGSELG